LLAQSCGADFNPLDGTFAAPYGSGADCVDYFEIATTSPGVLDVYTQTAFNCAVGATDCAHYLACATGGREAQSCNGQNSYCDGSSFVRCDAARMHPVFAFDCSNAMPAQGCVVGDGLAQCGSVTPCTNALPTCSASGGVITTCFGGQQAQAACDWLYPGTTCNADVFACVQGSGCKPGSFGMCGLHDALFTCSARGELITIDCASVFDGQCLIPAMSMSARCVTNVHECIPGERRCNGSQVDVCVNGRFHAFDCTSIGLTSCGANPSGLIVCQ
jgi:hypothetical protein